MGNGLPPIPAKVVDKILGAQFIDMARLLRDNMKVEQQHSTLESISACSSAWPAHREVPDLFSWVQCICRFASVKVNKHPEKTTQLWAYETVTPDVVAEGAGKYMIECFTCRQRHLIRQVTFHFFSLQSHSMASRRKKR